MPARPFLGIGQPERAEIEESMKSAVRRILTGGGGARRGRVYARGYCGSSNGVLMALSKWWRLVMTLPRRGHHPEH